MIAATREHYRQRRISECIRRYQPLALDAGKHGVRDPEPRRCGACDVRLSRVRPDHEEHCSRAANGWPPFEDGDGDFPAARATEAAMAAMEARRGR